MSDVFLVSSRTPDDAASWTRPKLLPLDQWPARVTSLDLSSLTGDEAVYEGDNLRLDLARQFTLGVDIVCRDRDGDGWTDWEEARLGTDPAVADTDGDGLADGADPCPTYTTPIAQKVDAEEVQMIQRALFATFGLSGSRYLLVVRPETPKVQVWGYAGPILYDKPFTPGCIRVSWEVSERTQAEAKVSIGDYEGPEAASSQYVRLRKIGGQWYVVKRELGPVA